MEQSEAAAATRGKRTYASLGGESADGGFGGRGGRRQSYPSYKRSRQNNQPPVDQGLTLLKRMLVLVTSNEVAQLADVFEAECRKDEGENNAMNALITCVEAFPTKTSTYALLIGIMAGKESARGLAAKLLVQTANKIQTGAGRSERLLVRFLGAAIKGSGIESNSFFDVLDALVEGDSEDKEISNLKESQVFTALSSIPWFACSASASRADETEDDNCTQRLKQLCEKISKLKRVSALPARLASLPRAQQDRTDPACDRIAMGIAMAKEGADNKLLLQDEEFDSLLIGHSPHLPRFGDCEFADLYDALNEAKVRISAASSSSTSPNADDFSPTLLPLFPNGQPTEGLQVQRREKWIERFLTREHVLDILGSYAPKAKEAAEALLALNSPYVAVESVFSAMLQMPTSEHSVLYYCDVLIQLCINAPDIIPVAIEDALDQMLALEPESMDPDAIDRLSFWLVCHLLEFDLDWPWIKWRDVPKLDSKRSVRSLVEQVLQRLDAVFPTRATLEDPDAEIPKELLEFLPSRNPNGDSRYFGPNADAMGEELVELLKTKPTAEQISSFLKAQTTEPEWNTVSRTRLLMHAALYYGKASFTHTKAALDRVAAAVKEIPASQDDDDQRLVVESALESVVDFWVNSPMWVVFAIGALVDVGIASKSATLQWLAERESRLQPYWKRRAMEDILARTSDAVELNTVIDAATSSDIDDATDLWLSRRRK